MNVVQATEDHVTEAIGWVERRGIVGIPRDTFSSVGFVVEGLAGVWLYLTGSTIAYGEMLVSNPDATKELRREAMSMVVATLLGCARSAGCRTVIAPCVREDVGAFLLANGFVCLGTNVYAANLGKD